MLKEKDKIAIAEELLGSCGSPGPIADRYDLDPFMGDLEVVQAANDHGVYLCECCGWWCDQDEMDDREGEFWCHDCLKEEE